MRFNVCFPVQSERLRANNIAVTSAQHFLDTQGDTNWLRSMLFPQPSDGVLQHTLNKRIIDLEFYHDMLNFEQQKAINTILREKHGRVPFILSGFPGVGKTKTLIELALQLIEKDPAAHLLVCAPSDSAADSIVQRLAPQLPRLLRINAPARSFPEVPNTVLPYCHVEGGFFTCPPHKELLRHRLIITTCRDAQLLVEARVTKRDLYHVEDNMHDILHSSSPPFKLRLHWTGLLVDEAAQATEPEILIPLSVILPPNHADLGQHDSPIFVLAGDAKQLGPRSASKSQAMQRSLFERLLDRPFYRDHQLARNKANGGIIPRLREEMLPIVRPAFTNLIHNYRSHPAILATPSALFYNDTLEPEAADPDSLLGWPGWKGRKWPVLFAANNAPDEIEKDGGGWYNNVEAGMALGYARSFVEAGLLEQRDICIMSPFAAQVKLLRQIVRQKFAMPAINIGPLEAFQGLESRLVVLCTTRTRDRFLDQDIAKGLGVIHEPKRLNVALTRAMQGLIVIGNPALLDQDYNWKVFLAFCARNGLHEELQDDVWLPEDDEVNVESRLERRMILQEGGMSPLTVAMRKLGAQNDPEQSLWETGIDAEESIRAETYRDGFPTLMIL